MNLLAEPRRVDFLRTSKNDNSTSPRPLLLFVIVLSVVGAGVFTPSKPVVLIPPGPLTLASLERAFLSPTTIRLGLRFEDPAESTTPSYAFTPVPGTGTPGVPLAFEETVAGSTAAPVVETVTGVHRQQLYAARVLGALVETKGGHVALIAPPPSVNITLMTPQGHVIATGGFSTVNPSPGVQRLLNAVEQRRTALLAKASKGVPDTDPPGNLSEVIEP